jgi:hypothetical protein
MRNIKIVLNALSPTFLTVVSTVISGVIVFIIGQILTTVWLHPLQNYKDLKQKIAEKLSFYARDYTNVIDLAKASEKEKMIYADASDDLRQLSCELTGFIETLSWIKIGIPRRKNLKKAADKLMLLSNSFFSPYNVTPNSKNNQLNHDTANEIRRLMKMYGY